MIKINIILFFIILSFSLRAEIVTETGKHKHLGKNYTKDQSCKIAEQKAKKNAIIKSLGQTVSTEVFSNCMEVDGEFDCERNQTALFELNGNITRYNIIDKVYGTEEGTEILFCEITIRANIEQVKKNLDPTFQFTAKLNQKIFRSGEKVQIEIKTSKKMYLTIFQWLPYGGKKYNVITKIFPNKDFNKNTNDLINGKLALTYEAYFPDEIKEDRVDEHFIFVASEQRIPWLPEYPQIEALKKQFSKTNILLENHSSGYILIR